MGQAMTHRMSAWGQVFHVLSQECGDLGLGCSEGCGSGPCPSLDFSSLLMRLPHPLCQRRGAGAEKVGMEIQPLFPACPWSWGYSP